MNEVERHDLEMVALRRRVECLEHRMSTLVPSDALEAAQALKFTALPEDSNARAHCAKQLHEAGWSYSRIARSLGVCEKTVARWCVGEGSL